MDYKMFQPLLNQNRTKQEQTQKLMRQWGVSKRSKEIQKHEYKNKILNTWSNPMN